MYYLDKQPEKLDLPNHLVVFRKEISKRGPKKCFFELDLYTTQFLNSLNDEIEKYLFGELDAKGAKAIQAFASGDRAAMHESFRAFFEYLDAQKLRTPKGLDWIKSCYPQLTQIELMREMQELRLMHCTMWSEAVREIVSAEQSDVKFIITDHPVTIYNAAFPLNSNQYAYPGDPSIKLIGSQIVFALDADHCLILTHLEYADNPSTTALAALRTNARYRGESLARTDTLIYKKRELKRNEVIAVNQLLKSRARRYIASSNEQWLYPEKEFSENNTNIAAILLPRHDLWQFGGEIYIGNNDGTTHYQDAFGRTSSAHEYLKKSPNAALGSNSPCGCGSGRKFKKCCKNLPKQDRPTWDIYGVRERNLMFCGVIKNIIGLQSGKTWDDVRRELSDEQVKDIYKALHSLWPTDTDLSELLPPPLKGGSRAVYFGIVDPRTLAFTVTGWLAYFDQLILVHPFLNPACVSQNYSPIEIPSQHKEDTLKNILLLLTLEPYIQKGFVHLVPDPADFNMEFARAAIPMARERTMDWEPDEEDLLSVMSLARDNRMRSLRKLPEASLREWFIKNIPKISIDKINEYITHMKSELAIDPYSLLQPISETGTQIWILKGYSLEAAIYIAGLTGSVLYTDTKAHWHQLKEYINDENSMRVGDIWKELIEAIREITFPIELDYRIAFDARRIGKFGKMRAMINRIAEAVQENKVNQSSQLALQISQSAEILRKEWAKSESTSTLDCCMDILISREGFLRNNNRRLFLNFGHKTITQSISLAILIKNKSTE